MADEVFRVVEFYSGIGGMHFALKGRGFDLHQYNLSPVLNLYYIGNCWLKLKLQNTGPLFINHKRVGSFGSLAP